MTLALTLWLCANALVAVLLGLRNRHQQPRDEQAQRPRRIRNREIRFVHAAANNSYRERNNG